MLHGAWLCINSTNHRGLFANYDEQFRLRQSNPWDFLKGLEKRPEEGSLRETLRIAENPLPSSRRGPYTAKNVDFAQNGRGLCTANRWNLHRTPSETLCATTIFGCGIF